MRVDVFTGVDQQFATAVLEEQLTTSTARGDWFAVAGHDGHGEETPAAESREVAHERALGAEREAVTRVLDIGALNETPVGRDGARADRDVRVRRVRGGRRVTGPFT